MPCRVGSCSASLKAQWGAGSVKPVLAGARSIRKVFSREQRDFFAANAPEGQTLDDLVPLGPINVLKLRFVPKSFPRRMVAELWFYPNGTRILELSTKCQRGSVPGRGRDAGLPLRKRGGPHRSAGDQDADGARAFLQGASKQPCMTARPAASEASGGIGRWFTRRLPAGPPGQAISSTA